MTSSAGPLTFFATPPHPCNYLPGREAVTVFADPRLPSMRLYCLLSRHGFRRSGQHIYRPHCPGCAACVPVRVAVQRFSPRRSQRRAWRTNADLTVVARQPVFRPEHFSLYARYLAWRHPGGGMDNPTERQYLEFLTSPWANTVFYELRLERTLLGVAVVDRLDDGLSAVYTFYEPAMAARSLGVYAVLWEIAKARRLGLEWLYLGYWIRQSPRMSYKAEYQPLQYLCDGRWSETPQC
jgi:arginine-tRNA-protein transferase